MNILISAYTCEPNRGSEPGCGWNWARSLSRLGHKVVVLTRKNGEKSIKSELDTHPNRNLKVIYIKTPKYIKPFMRGQMGVYLHYQLWQIAAFEYARKNIKDVDIIHHVTWGSLHHGSFLGNLKFPFVMGPVSGGQKAPQAFREYFGNAWAGEALRNKIVDYLPYSITFKNLIKHTDLFLAANIDTYRLVKNNGGKRIELFLDAGLPEEYIPLNCPIKKPTDILKILWVGRLYPIKGLPLVLEALTKLKLPFQLTIVGGGPLQNKKIEWEQKYKLDEKIIWRGQIAWNEVAKEYINNDLFIFTSLREAFGSQLLEAMAYGLPIVTLDLFGAHDFLPDEGVIKVPVTIPEETVNGLVKGVTRLLENESERKKMGKINYEFAKTQTWDRKILQMNALYHELC